MYVVRFVRKDGQPDEEYYYNRLEDAQYHFNLFKKDDSELYCEIMINNVEEIQEQKICFYQPGI